MIGVMIMECCNCKRQVQDYHTGQFGELYCVDCFKGRPPSPQERIDTLGAELERYETARQEDANIISRLQAEKTSAVNSRADVVAELDIERDLTTRLSDHLAQIEKQREKVLAERDEAQAENARLMEALVDLRDYFTNPKYTPTKVIALNRISAVLDSATSVHAPDDDDLAPLESAQAISKHLDHLANADTAAYWEAIAEMEVASDHAPDATPGPDGLTQILPTGVEFTLDLNEADGVTCEKCFRPMVYTGRSLPTGAIYACHCCHVEVLRMEGVGE